MVGLDHVAFGLLSLKNTFWASTHIHLTVALTKKILDCKALIKRLLTESMVNYYCWRVIPYGL